MSDHDVLKFLVNITICILYRTSGYYDRCLFIQHGVSLLEDLVITLADGIASMYLELISVDSSTSSEMNSLGLSLCSLSTRALQRLRNEVPVFFHSICHYNSSPCCPFPFLPIQELVLVDDYG